jgi:hypothetical protein
MIKTLVTNVMLMQEKIQKRLKRDDCLEQSIGAIKRELEKTTGI